MKGVEATTGKRLSEVVGEFVDESKTPVAVWVGGTSPGLCKRYSELYGY